MKYLLILLFPCFLNGQTLDVSAVDIIDDSTTVEVQRDTVYFQIESGTKLRPGKPSVTLYRATLITVQGGQKSAALTSGIVTEKQLNEWLRAQRAWINADIKRSQEIVDRYKQLKGQITALLGR